MKHFFYEADPKGWVMSWKTPAGKDILYSVPGSIDHGGIKISTSFQSPGQNLLQHLHQSHPVDFSAIPSDNCEERSYRIAFLNKLTNPWQHSVLIRHTRRLNYGQLELDIIIERSFGCLHPGPMPLRLDLRCYLATQRKEVQLRCNGNFLMDSDLTPDEIRILSEDVLQRPLTVETFSGLITFSPLFGFERIKVMRDPYGEFLCVYPTATTTLNPGQSRRFVCQLTYLDK